MSQSNPTELRVKVEIPNEIIQALADRIGHAVGRSVAGELSLGHAPPGATPSEVAVEAGMVGIRRVAEVLSLSERTVWGMTQQNAMPKPVRFGRSVRWSLEEIHAWIRAGCPTGSEWQKIKSKFLV